MLNNKIFLNYSSEDIVWDGPTISCINLCKGDIVSNIIYNIAIRLCEIVDDIKDLENIDLECIIDKCDATLCIEDHSLLNLLKLIQKNDCSLKDLIDSVSNEIIEKKNIKLNLDLSCLKVCPDYKVPKYNFLCANGGNSGDEIKVIYKTLFNSTPTTIILKAGQCIKFDLPKYKLTIISSTIITSGSNIQAEVIDSIGFDNCPNCELYINNIIDSVTFPRFYKQKDFTLNQILQYFIYRICCNEHNLSDIELKLGILETVYNKIITTFSSYIEPKLSTCINNTPVVHSLLTTKLSDYVCSLRKTIGTHQQILNSANSHCYSRWISNNFPGTCSKFPTPFRFLTSVLIDGVTYIINQSIHEGSATIICNTLNSNLPASLAHFTVHSSGQIQFNSTATSITIFMIDCDGITPISISFILNMIPATTLAEDSLNQWAVICDILNRVKSQENSACCLPDCGELKFGYKFVYSESDQIYKLYFTKAYGTKIPLGWTDNGSILTIKDINEAVYSTSITITDSSEIDIDLDGLVSSKEMNVSIKTNFINDNGLVCKDILTGHLDPISSPCQYCKICAYGTNSTDQLKVSYFTENNKDIKTQILSVGSCLVFKIPEENPTLVNITALNSNSDIILAPDPSSECNDIIIPEVKQNTCWFFTLPISETFNISAKQWEVLTSPATKVNFDFEELGINTFTYKSVLLESGGVVTLSGSTLSCTVNNFGMLSSSSDKATIISNSPSYTSGIASSKVCGSYEVTYDGDLTSSGSLNVVGLVLHGDKEIKYGYNGTGTLGVVLELQGQSPENIPELVLVDPITGTEMNIKGSYLESNCDCI